MGYVAEKNMEIDQNFESGNDWLVFAVQLLQYLNGNEIYNTI